MASHTTKQSTVHNLVVLLLLLQVELCRGHLCLRHCVPSGVYKWRRLHSLGPGEGRCGDCGWHCSW